MADKGKDIKFKHYGTLNEIIDEKGSMYIAMRKTAWYNGDVAPGEDKAKLEIRKWKVQDGDNEDFPQKGVSFLTDEGPHNLTYALLQNGYGETKQVLRTLKERKDFKDAVQHMYDDDDTGEDGFFDARSQLLTD